MKFETKYKIIIWKRYFDTGYSLTSYFKYGLIALAVLQPQWKNFLTIVGFIYVPLCLPLGYYWYKFHWIEAEAEVGNQYNRFQKEVRKFIKKKHLNKRNNR